MDEERIGLVLAKTSELRSKIINCIHKTAPNLEGESGKSESRESEASPDAENQDYDGDEEEEEEEEEAEALLNIKDALESLEGQLSSLQALQQQQWYEKEAALSEIECSQKKLLTELKQYKGKDLQVIHEAISFATLATDDNSNDLLLPPYPSRPPHPIVPENGLFSSSRKFGQNGSPKNPDDGSGGDRRLAGPWGALISVGGFIKTALAIVGVFGVLSLAGFEPQMRKQDNGFVKIVGLFRVNGEKGRGSSVAACPPGKVAVMENGETRCVVKERVEVPFESSVATPDVSYGCG